MPNQTFRFGGRFFCFALLLLALAQAPLAPGGTLVQFRTVVGTIEVDLFDQQKPETVRNFLRYLRSGYYQNVFLHRCVPNFVLQGGEYVTLETSLTSLLQPTDVYIWPNFPPIVNEFGVGPRLSNTYGTVAMARSPGVTNSATSQFFFNLADNTSLDGVDGGFTVFGRVVRGTNVLNYFNSLRYNSGIIDMRNYTADPGFGEVFKELPVFYFGPGHPRISDLIYVDITLLRVNVRRIEGGWEISWDSIGGRPNRVEYSTSIPPVWTTLTTVSGTGERMTVTDTATSTSGRFYRVRVDY